MNGADKSGFGDIRSLSTNERAAFFRASATTNLNGTASQAVIISSETSTIQVGETELITFIFSRDPGSSFTAADISVSGGTLSPLSGTGLTRTAIFTPTPNSAGTASITVGAGSYIDIIGKAGSAGTTPDLTYDTRIAIDLSSIAAGTGGFVINGQCR